MSFEYSENELVQNSAIELLRDTLKWRTFYAYNDEVLDDDSSHKSIGRKSYKEILLTRYLKEAVFKLTPTLFTTDPTTSSRDSASFFWFTSC